MDKDVDLSNSRQNQDTYPNIFHTFKYVYMCTYI